MNNSGVSPDLLIPASKALLLGSFGYCLARSTRGDVGLQVAFERLIVGMIALAFFKSAASTLDSLSAQLTAAIGRIGDHEDLKAILLVAFEKAANAPSASGTPTSFNIPAILEQAWRTSVWGVMTSLVEGVFLIVSFVLECAKEVLWKLLLLLFPLAAGVYPIFPRMMTNLLIYAVELSFWFPMLHLVEIATGSVARKHMAMAGSWGLYVVAVQIIAIILILLIPSITHRFLSGAFSGDFNSHSSIILLIRRAATRSWRKA